MHFVNLVSSLPSSTFAEFHPEPNYGGGGSTRTRGEYSADKVLSQPVKSVKLSEFCSVGFYENAAGPGKSFVADASVPSLNLDFTPTLVTVSSHVKATKGGKTDILEQGEYEVEDIKGYEKLAIPRGLYLIFMGNREDENAVHLFENEVYAVDSRLDGYSKVAIIALGDNDIRINFKNSEELSDDDLLSVAGGSCKIDVCNAKACGADNVCAGKAEACGAKN